jgi:cytidine deaminase
MDFAELEGSDIALFDRAAAVLTRSHHPERHQVAAAMLGASGQVHIGLHLGSRRVNVCAESCARARARRAGEERVIAAVAVCMGGAGTPQVTNPCGVCRELMGTYCPDAMVLLDVGGTVRKAAVADLMPLPWLRPEETGWTVETPTVR